MSVYGYLNHTSTDKRDEEAIRAMFAALPCESVTVEQLWSPGEKHRPAFDALVDRLEPGDTLYVHSIDRLGAGVTEVVRVWRTVTEDRQADIVVLDNPKLDSRSERRPTLPQVRGAAQRTFDAIKPPPTGGSLETRAAARK